MKINTIQTARNLAYGLELRIAGMKRRGESPDKIERTRVMLADMLEIADMLEKIETIEKDNTK